MIKKILIIANIIVLTNSGFSQQYTPMVKDSSIWNKTICNIAMFPWEEDMYYTESYCMLGDTIINSISYKKIYIIPCVRDSVALSTLTYFGAMREDSLKKVYFINDTVERVEYDFSLNLGDTFNYTSTNGSELLIVNSVDSIQINGQTRRVFDMWPVPSGWTHPWVEGVGSLASLTDYTYGNGNFDVYLSCYFEYFDLVYPVVTYDCCLGIVNVEEQFYDKNYVQIFPNPSHENFNLLFKQNKKYLIEIYDVQYRLIQSLNTNGNSLTLNLSNYNEGVYFVRIKCDNYTLIKKIIKM